MISLHIFSYFLYFWENWPLWITKTFCQPDLRAQSFYIIGDLLQLNFHLAKNGMCIFFANLHQDLLRNRPPFFVFHYQVSENRTTGGDIIQLMLYIKCLTETQNNVIFCEPIFLKMVRMMINFVASHCFQQKWQERIHQYLSGW